SLIRSLRSVMRLRRALPAQSCGNSTAGLNGENSKKNGAQKNARKALLSDIGLFGLLYETSFFQLVIPGSTDP
ncbi:hypothetical protein, partial [Salmonella enterica]|uniref:hypothetical protein n=1 Tax=Salmonella enterica TaxID=28901 RepID=UPI001F410E05